MDFTATITEAYKSWINDDQRSTIEPDKGVPSKN
jgi:hypothetical protein